MTTTITSPHNEQLKLVRRLASRRGRAKEGLFVTEGEDLLDAGLAAGRQPTAVLVSSEAPGAAAAWEGATAVTAELLAGVSALGSGTRVLAIWPLPAPQAAPAAGPCVYLHGVGDPGNLGTILRTAAALCDAPVVAGPGCADPYGPKATRASMGALFARPPLAGGIEATPAPRLGLAAHGGPTLEQALGALMPATVCLGAEREGLGRELLGRCDAVATIPIHGGAESLNVAATAAIALYRVCSAAGRGSVSPGPPAEGEHEEPPAGLEGKR